MPINETRIRRYLRGLILTGGLVAAAAQGPHSAAGDPLPGPIAATVVRVVDGDTVRVRARVWLDQDLEVAVRIAGIDAPELRARCDAERRLAEAARARLATTLGERTVILYDVAHDKYAGRVVARVLDSDGRDIGALLLRDGFAVPYAAGGAAAWCGSDQAERE